MNIRKIRISYFILILSFTIFTLFSTVLSNSYFLSKRLKEEYFFTVELQKNLTTQEINDFEKILLSHPNVRGVKFLGREEAFYALQKELEIVIPRSENPLPNSMIISFETENDLAILQEFLDVNPNIREIFIDSNFIQNIQRKVNVLDTVMIISVLFLLAVMVQINIILRGEIFKDYMFHYLKTPENPKNFMLARNKNLIPLFLSSIIGSLIFFNIYIVFRGKLSAMLPDLIIQSFSQLILFHIGLLLVFLVYSWKTSIRGRYGV